MQTGLRNTLVLLVRTWLVITLLFSMASVPESASAALGGDMESVDADQTALNAAEQIATSSDSYTVYELRTPAGTVVREFLSLDGRVFAVAWKGPLLPDLRQILGEYFKQYAEAAHNQHGDHGHLVIRRSDLVVESSGRMRAFSGRAYLPRAMPQDLAVSDIQ